MRTYWIVTDPVQEEDPAIVVLGKVLGRVDIVDTAAVDLLETGKCVLAPYGTGERDENSNIKSFKLVGFNIVQKHE